MKSLLFFVLMMGLVFGNATAQTPCCPYIDSIVVMPPNPTDEDTIRIATRTTSPALGHQIYYLHYLVDDTIYLEGCFYSGMLTAIQVYDDTSVIGTLPAGTYTIYYVGKLSNTPELCEVTMYQTMTHTLVVTPSIPISTDDLTVTDAPMFQVYPNPSEGLFSVQAKHPAQEEIQWEVFDLNGRLLKAGNPGRGADKWSVDMTSFSQGLYMMRITTPHGVDTQKIVVK